MDSADNLYGTTSAGGTGGSVSSGTVFKLTPNGSSGYTESVLHNFPSDSTDGINPFACLVLTRRETNTAPQVLEELTAKARYSNCSGSKGKWIKPSPTISEGRETGRLRNSVE